MYLAYPDYLSYGGTLDETAFINYEWQAESRVNYITFSRLKHDKVIPEEVKRLIFQLISIIQKSEQAMSLGSSSDGVGPQIITAQSNDGVSVTYSGIEASELFTYCREEMDKAIFFYLDDVRNEAGQKILYRGLYPGE